MIKIVSLLSALLFVSVPYESQAASGDQDFYKGKTIRIIVGFAAGGGFDVYSRTIARHMPKHLPGNPSMIVDNMTGAGSRLAANYLYKASSPDGLTMAILLVRLCSNRFWAIRVSSLTAGNLSGSVHPSWMTPHAP